MRRLSNLAEDDRQKLSSSRCARNPFPLGVAGPWCTVGLEFGLRRVLLELPGPPEIHYGRGQNVPATVDFKRSSGGAKDNKNPLT